MLEKLMNRATQLNTTIMGLVAGTGLAGVVHFVLVEQAKCQFDGINWAAVLSFVIPALHGLLSTDSGKS